MWPLRNQTCHLRLPQAETTTRRKGSNKDKADAASFILDPFAEHLPGARQCPRLWRHSRTRHKNPCPPRAGTLARKEGGQMTEKLNSDRGSVVTSGEG